MNILDPQQQAALNDPMLGLTGDKPANVRDQVTPSKEYQTALQGAGIIGAFGHASKGRWMGGIMSGLGMGGAGMADYVLNPAANKAQTAVDTAWLGHARNRDRLEQPFSFRGKGAKMSGPAVGNLMEGISKQSERGQTLIRKKLSSYQVHLTGLVLEAAHARSAIDRGAGVLVPKRVPGEKVSSKVVISSPLEKRANFNAVLRESVGMTPYEVPGMGGGGLFSEAWKNRPAAVGGKPKWMHTAAGLKDLLMRDELVVNASGVPVGRNRTFLPGMPGKFLRIPLALGGLMALNAGVQSWQDKRHAAGADARFENALTSLRNDEMFRDSQLDMIDPNSEAGKLTIPKVREGFDVLDRYAPDVSSDPQLASQFVESLVAGVDTEGVAMSPAEYSQHVEQALSLQNAIDKRKDKTIFGNLSGMVTDLIDPE